jgi:pyruvate dehydrogenase E2 component (dihydrolipoamide acetyltransferase)
MDVRLPNLGEGADSGSVVGIHVKEGDLIKKGQTILELENEKAVAPIPSPADGTVTKIQVKAGDKLSVGQLILTLSGDGESGAKVSPKGAEVAPAATREQQSPEPAAPVTEDRAPISGGEFTPQTSKAGTPPPASPSIRKLARDLGIDLTRVRGSEDGGRIVLKDVRAYIQRLQEIAFPNKPGKVAPTAPEAIDFSKWGPVKRQAMSSLRRTISQRMVESWTTIPRVTQFDEADITDLMALRKSLSPAYETKGTRLTLTCFALKAVVRVLKRFPLFNSSLDEATQEIILKEYFHIGLAVDTEAGLLVPVIKDVDKKNMLTLAKELNDLAGKARDRKVALEDLKGGTFTISNQGGIGGAHFTPIVNKPEVAILGLGRGLTKPAVKDKKIEARMMLPLCLSYDHRVIDGGQAARFIQELLQAFENFDPADAKI